MLEIGLDMDGVIVDFISPLAKWMGIKSTQIISYKLEEMFPEKKDQIRSFYSQKGYFKNLDPYKGAISFIEKLQKLENIRIWFVSKPTKFAPITWADKVEWILNHTPQLIQTTILTGDKSLIKVDVLIDDDPNNLTSSIAKYKFLFDQPWNQDDKTFKRFKDYKELYDQIKNLKEK